MSELPSKDQTKIRALIKTKDPDNVDFACNLLETLGASDGDWVKLFPKTRIYGLLVTEDTKIWNTLAKAMRPPDRAYEELKAQVKKCVSKVALDCTWRVRGTIVYQCADLIKVANDDLINLLLCVHHPAAIIEMCLENKTELSDGVKELIANFDGELNDEDGCVRYVRRNAFVGASTDLTLNGLTELSEEIAASLVKVKGGLYLDGLTELSDGLAKVLSKHKLSPEERATEAEKIYNSGVIDPCAGLTLNGLTVLGDVAAGSLAKVNGGLCLNGLTKLSDKAARALSNHESEVGLRLNGLTKLSGEAAASLAKVGGGLCLNGLTKLSNEAAQGLSNYESQGNIGLCLDGLTELSNEAAGYLAKVKGCLSLKGLTNLSHEAVQALSNHKAGANWRRHDDDGGHPAERPGYVMELNLRGLTELKDDVAKALSKHKGALGLPAKANPPLQKGHGFIQHIELGDAAASALAKKKGTINCYDPQEYVDLWKDE